MSLESSVLVIVKNGDRVLDSGSGLILCHDPKSATTFVLTCEHNLRAIRKTYQSNVEAPKVFVNGQLANAYADPSLRLYDLAVLCLPQLELPPVRLKALAKTQGIFSCHGFVPFMQKEFVQETVRCAAKQVIATLSPEGVRVAYYKIQTSKGSPRFKKGLSGAPVFDPAGNVVGVARIVQKTASHKDDEKGEVLGYAIQLTPRVLYLLSETVPYDLDIVGKRKVATDRPPDAPKPKSESIKADDIQKGRWGGKSEGWSFQLSPQNVEKHKYYFTFDAVLEKKEPGTVPQGPFVFHLHDSYPRSVIWVRRVRGQKSILENIHAEGTYTFGVQFKGDDNQWHSLEYDLANYDKGALTNYDE
jgi:hypothetical protein